MSKSNHSDAETSPEPRPDRASELHASPGAPRGDDLPDDLPPVEPPSASFIMQLFMVPGLIVAAVIGVWALFGKISTSEQDWRQQVTELRSNNEQRRWRGANGLAQMLRADIEVGDGGQRLSDNRQIADDLAGLLKELLDSPLQDEELVSQQSFVARTLGWLNSVDVVMPVLEEASQSRFELLVRTDALRSIAVIAGRLKELEKPVQRQETIDCVIEASLDADALVRQIAAFTLGLLPGNDADQRLRVLAEDSDPDTRVNAAIALTRRGMTDGFSVFLGVLKTAPDRVDPASMPGETDGERMLLAVNRQKMNVVVLGNVSKALRDLGPNLSPEQRAEAVTMCQPIAADFREIKIRIEAEQTIAALE